MGGGNSIKNYMRFVAIEDSQINLTSINIATREADNSVDLKHSKDGVTWTQYNFNPIPLAAGETLYLKGNNENGFSNDIRVCSFGDTPISNVDDTLSTGKFECHGNIMSLLYGDDFEDKTTIPSTRCFFYLFRNCTLTTAPELPATTLANYCYSHMFNGCDSLTTAPELPATTLSSGCYSNMFLSCWNLTTAPELPATTLVSECYNQMFYDCRSLNHITMLATDISASNCLKDWVYGVSPTGTFVKHPDMTSLPTGTSGIRYGWTVIDYDYNVG